MNTIHATVPQPKSETASGSTGGIPSSQGLNDMFLQLLVAQLQNQNPLTPMDPTQFVGQLAQFSELSEITQIRELMQERATPTSNSTAASASHPGNSNQYSHIASPSLNRTVVSSPTSEPQPADADPQDPRSWFKHAVQGAF
jgi:Flagellar hook capping protein - N-terminal region